jgi:hypothetical protein
MSATAARPRNAEGYAPEPMCQNRDANVLFELQPLTSHPRSRTSKVMSKSMRYNRPRPGSLSARLFTDAGGRQMLAGLQPLCLYQESMLLLRDGGTGEAYASPCLYSTSYRYS